MPGADGEIDALLRRYAQTRDLAVRDEILTAHLGLVEQLARRFARRGEPLDDLVQVGAIGLIKALDRFDPDLGFAFAAFATTTVVGELKRHFRDKGWAVRAPRRIQELYLQIGRLVEELSQELGRAPTVRELAAASGASEQDIIEALEATHSYRVASLDAPAGDGGSLLAILAGTDRSLERADDRLALLPLLAALPERERLILELRFVEDLTQSEIANRVGVSQMHVSRLIARSLATLRAHLVAD